MLNKKQLFILVAILIIFTITPAAGFEGDSFYGSEETTLNVEGDIYPSFRFFSDDSDLEENLRGKFALSYPGQQHEVKALLNYQIGAVEEIELNELYYRYYGNNYDILIGKNRLVWGQGDQLHVVDNLNPEDMSDFINQNYLDRQIGEEMIKIDRYFRGGRANLEFVYTPNFNGHRLADDPDSPLGNWVMNPLAGYGFSSENLTELQLKLGLSTSQIINQINSAIEAEDNQFGLRFTDSRSGTDYGFSYYKGYLREPSFNKEVLNNLNPAAINSIEEFNQTLATAELHYDEVDILGFEMARVIGDINSRMELAYFRTDDSDGDDPLTKNNRVSWVIGGDRNLPISNLNLNLQFTGEKILDDDQIENNPYHIDYNIDGDYTTHRLVVNLEDSYRNEQIIPQLTWVYNLNDNDYSLEAALDYELSSDLELQLSHKIFRGDSDTIFGQFEDNAFTRVGLKYSF